MFLYPFTLQFWGINAIILSCLVTPGNYLTDFQKDFILKTAAFATELLLPKK